MSATNGNSTPRHADTAKLRSDLRWSHWLTMFPRPIATKVADVSDPAAPNPYQVAIAALGATLSPFDATQYRGRELPGQHPPASDSRGGFGGDAALHLASPSTPKGVAEELAVLRSIHRALGFVHAEAKTRVELPKQLHHALARSPRPHVYVAVVGIADERVSAFLQLLVDLVQEHVREQRRERSALQSQNTSGLEGLLPKSTGS